MLRILVADDHEIVRKGLASILSEQPEPVEVTEASDGLEVLEALRNGDIDLVVLDIAMPRMTGLRVLEEIRQLYPALPVIILSVHSAAMYVQQSLKLGASAYLCKESASAELLDAVSATRAGQTYICRMLRDAVQ